LVQLTPSLPANNTCTQVRFTEAQEEEDGPILEVLPAPVPEQYRPKTFDEQTVDLAPADKDALARNRQGYAVFPMVRTRVLEVVFDVVQRERV
jgi:hypothetical protein